MRYAIWVVVGSLIVMCGCKGGGADEMDDALSPAEQLEELSLDRLQGGTDEQTAIVEGLLTLEGMTLVEPPAESAAVSQVPDPRVLVRLLDPGDDILSEVNPDLSGDFRLEYIGDALDAKLQVEFTVVEDLDGDGEGEDLVTQSVPLALAPGHVAEVSLHLALADQDAPPGGSPLGQEVVVAVVGEVLLVELESLDTNGYHDEFYGVFFADGFTIYDVDDDQFLEPGDDYLGSDADSNGWVDPLEQGFSAPVAAMEVLEGTVTDVSIADQTLQVRLTDGRLVDILIDQFTSIEPLTAESEFYGTLPLDASLIGRRVQIDAVPVADGYLALWIVVPGYMPDPA